MSIGKQDLQELAQGLGEYQQKYAIDLARTEAMMGDPSRLNALMQMQQPARPKGPAAFEEFLLARQYPEFGEFLQAKRKAGEKGFQELGAKKYENRLDLAMSAQASNINLDNLENILNQGLRTGFGASLGLQLNRIGQTLLGPDFKAGNIAGAESFAAGATQLILPEVKKLGVNPTDKDLDFVVKGSPELGKSVEGNKLMLKALRLSNLRAIDSHNFDNAFYSNPENEGKTEIDRNVAFQTHMLNNPQLYNAQSLIEEYNSLLEREAANKLNQGDFVDTSNEELPEGM